MNSYGNKQLQPTHTPKRQAEQRVNHTHLAELPIHSSRGQMLGVQTSWVGNLGLQVVEYGLRRCTIPDWRLEPGQIR
jgi:hypothetical protein